MSWWGRLLAGLPVTAPERDSIWSVPRPFVRLYLVLFAIQAGWLVSLAVRDVLATHGFQGAEAVAYETLSGLSQPGVGAAISSLLIVEVISYLMVMYNFLMHHFVRPIILRHERRGEARGIEKGDSARRSPSHPALARMGTGALKPRVCNSPSRRLITPAGGVRADGNVQLY